MAHGPTCQRSRQALVPAHSTAQLKAGSLDGLSAVACCCIQGEGSTLRHLSRVLPWHAGGTPVQREREAHSVHADAVGGCGEHVMHLICIEVAATANLHLRRNRTAPIMYSRIVQRS